MAESVRGKILKFFPVCNNFDKALVSINEGRGLIWSLAPKIKGVQVYTKGGEVAYTPGPLIVYRGHEVRGSLAAVELLDDPQAAEDAESWGLT